MKLAMLILPHSLRRFLSVVVCTAFVLGSAPDKTVAAENSQTARIVEAATSFLKMLNDSQRETVLFKLDNAEQRVRWSNLPVNMAKHGGLRMGDLNGDQRAAVMSLLASTLSKMGYEKVVGIVAGDELLRKQSGAGSPPFGRDEYYVSFMGKPSVTEPWMLQFGGHHLALNITVAEDQGVLTPSLIAVQPATYVLDGKTIRPLGRETDKALELVKSLHESQRKEAILGFQMRDLVLGPGPDGETIQPEGIQATSLTPAQRQLLIELVSEWSGIIFVAAAARKLDEIKSHLDETWFAWSGPLESGKAYFRIQGPTVVIEYAPQRLGGDVTMHLHTMYRDPGNDYGKMLMAR